MSAPSTPATHADAAELLLEEIALSGRHPQLHGVSGTIRVDLRDGDGTQRWYLAIENETVAVSHRNAKADVVLRMDRELFDGMCRGTVNGTAALLRGLIEYEGDLTLITALARLLPGPPDSRASFLERGKEQVR
jgi:putative sterol carrier protein